MMLPEVLAGWVLGDVKPHWNSCLSPCKHQRVTHAACVLGRACMRRPCQHGAQMQALRRPQADAQLRWPSRPRG